MLGMIINEKEHKELQYLLKREMDEIIFDRNDERIEPLIKRAMQERYHLLFNLFKRIADPYEYMKYMPTKNRIKKV
ncbi:hypothetical protein CVD25_03335 [Bacillus canaveralius]|uniref:Uncharacterized protein n=2 Tax=Bacillus canaveralius TaxID=1403243 RepID=A0A2N5GPR8_9BACI|nr:hypothetical protein [Bacillus canaveralius]PLR84726.1 hypothetical protein CU635_05460 [Bacillus canaveralius]PLS00449.1 hypothetical protein CVD25_03335 [Bacillus canaveralius]RSK52269.1 hypothetical protein EJA13_12070 [Bacillus canaveralius]